MPLKATLNIFEGWKIKRTWLLSIQNHPFADVLQNRYGILKNFTNYTGKHLCRGLFIIKLQTWRPATLWKRDSNTVVFLAVEFSKLSLRNSSDGCFCLFICGCISTFCWIRFTLNWFLGADFAICENLHSFVSILFFLKYRKARIFSRMCFAKKLFLKFSQNLQENTSLGVSFL